MKADINGIHYNTKTANLIGSAGKPGIHWCRSYHRFWLAGLHVTQEGEYFLAGVGGPLSIFAKYQKDGAVSCGVKIIPLNEHEALTWATRHLSRRAVKREFGSWWQRFWRQHGSI